MSQRIWLFGIFVLAAIIRIWMASSDLYLHEWDERFHALVAKNLLLHPLKPTLYETPLLPYDFKEWASNHIWLSKPPLPLWMMALSLKLWGLTEWAIRFPSILFSLGSVWLTYKIGDQLWGRKVALWAAFFHAIHGLTLELTAGRFSSDHVETAFLFWMELGFWVIVQYFESDSRASFRRNALLLGFITGLAFLCKWSAAFMLPIVWAGMILWTKKQPLKSFLTDGLLAILVFVLISSPWPLYVLANYPLEAKAMAQSLIAPVQEVVQTHGGPWYFYVLKSGVMFGYAIYLPLLWLLWLAVKSWEKTDRTAFGRSYLAVWIFVPLVLLSCAATKRPTYLLVTAPAFYLLTALFMRVLLLRRPGQGYLKILRNLVLAALLLLPIRYAVERSKLFFDRETNPVWAQQLKELGQKEDYNASKVVVFNEQHPIEAMFYTSFVAYSWTPGVDRTEQLKQEGWRVLEYKEGKYLER